MTTASYKAAIIGLGGIAWKYDKNCASGTAPQTHAGVYSTHKQVILAGGCSPLEDERLCFARRYGAEVFDSVDKLLNQTHPDIVSICSPSDMHFEHTCRCIDAAVPMIWLEKPPTTKLPDLDMLIKKQLGSASTILVNYQRRYSKNYNQLKEFYTNQTLGKTLFIHLTYSRGLSLNGSHIIDVLFFILGDDVQLSLEAVLPSDDKDNPAFALRTSNGLRIFVAGMSLPYHCIDVTLTCENGRMSVLYGGMETLLETKVEHQRFTGFYRLKKQEKHNLESGGLDHAMSEALDDLIISHQQKKQPRSSLKTARNTLSIINAVETAG